MNAQLMQLINMLKQGAGPAMEAGKGLLKGAGGMVGQGARGLRDIAGPALTGVSKFATANPMAAGGIGAGAAAGAGGLGIAALLRMLQGEQEEMPEMGEELLKTLLMKQQGMPQMPQGGNI
jgi:hypothetical protein